MIVRIYNDQVVYVKRFQSTRAINQLRIGVDAEGNCYAVGTFRERITIDSLTRITDPKHSYFVTKLDPTGTPSYLQFSSPIAVSTYLNAELDCTDEGVCVVVGTLPQATDLTVTMGSASFTYSTANSLSLVLFRVDLIRIRSGE